MAKSEVRDIQGSGRRENRRSQRIPIHLLVDYRCNGHYLFDFCRDLGSGGVFIETTSPVPTGSKVDLTFTIPDSKETLETTGKVIWVQGKVKERPDLPPGMGVQFDAFNDEQRSILEAFVKRYRETNGSEDTADKASKPARGSA